MSLKELKSDYKRAYDILQEIDTKYKPGSKANRENKLAAFKRYNFLKNKVENYNKYPLVSVAFDFNKKRYYATYVQCSDDECLELLKSDYPDIMKDATNIVFRHYVSNTLFILQD